jgi:hypothetical protein
VLAVLWGRHPHSPWHLRTGTVNGGTTPAVTGLDLSVTLHKGHYGLNKRQLLESLGILDTQRTLATEHPHRGPVCRRASGVDPHQRGAELGKFRQHITVHTFTNGSQQHHSGNTDSNTQGGQYTAQSARGE